MGLIAASTVEEDAAALLSRSRIRQDAGHYEEALRDAEAALVLAPDCGACAVQAGYCHLGVAGLDMFQLTRRMMDKNTGEDETTKALLLAEDGNASGQLRSLSTLLGLGPSDLEAISLPGNRMDNLEGAPTTGPFRDLPVFMPKSAAEARISASPLLQHIARAVELICPFMPATVKILGDRPDLRHGGEGCNRDVPLNRAGTNALFVWAVAHLVEAIAFHQVVLYTEDGVTPNLQKRATLLEKQDGLTSLTEYVAAVQELAAVVDIILPTEERVAHASMLTAMFNDLQTVSLAFQQMAAVPASLSNGIVRSIAELQERKDKISGGGSAAGRDQGAVAFKDQLTEGMAAELKKQITGKISADQLTHQERQDLCRAYERISTQIIAGCETP